MGFRPWGYKMNSPSTGLITEQYSLSLIYYSVYEFFLFFPSGHRFPFLSPFIWMLANCKIVLLHVLRPCAINLHSWCLWNGCIEHGWHIASHRVTWANVPLELSLCLLSTSWLQKLPGIGHYMQKPPINSIIRKSLFFFFPSPTMVAILFFLWAISFMLRSASYSDCEDKATPNVSSSLCWCSPCNVINAAPVSSLQLISHAFVIALKPGRKKDYTRKAFRALCQKAKPKTLWISLNTNHFIKS